MEHNELGKKTFFFLIIKRSGFALACAVMLIASIAFLDVLPGKAQAYGDIIVFFGIVFVLVSIAATFGIAVLEYRNFTVAIYDRNIKITHGILNRHEVGIPYKTIERVDLMRTLINQIFGVSDIRIHIVQDDNPSTKEEVFTIPFVEKKLAESIQKEIIEHSQVEHIKDIAGNPVLK